MSNKILLYFAVTPLVVYAMSSLNINSIFKKNSVVAARIFYCLIGLSLIYIITNLLYDIYSFL